MVALGILASRTVGLVRQRVFAHYFGIGDAADAFAAAFRIPNLLQNLFGEGALSASFIPVYSGLLARGEEAEARRTAGAVAALLGLVVAVIVLAGVLLTPWLIAAVAGGFTGPKRELTITLVRIFFPGAGLLVLSAWCLGVLNSHRRFLLSYSAPVVWNVAIIAALVFGAERGDQMQLAVWAAWGSVAGSFLQFAVQLPAIRATAGPIPLRPSRSGPVQAVLRTFVPALISRGVVQVSSYVDLLLATLLPAGATAAIATAQLLSNLPISLFGMAITAAELPEMSRDVTGEHARSALHERLGRALQQVAYYIVPSAAAFAATGFAAVGFLFQSGRFGAAETEYVWWILAGSSTGLLASTRARLVSSAFHALGDTRTPLRYALLRVGAGMLLGYLLALPVPRALGLDPRLGAVGLALASGLAGWLEYLLLRAALEARIGRIAAPGDLMVRLWTAAGLASAAGWAVQWWLPAASLVVRPAAVLGAFALTYGAVTYLLGVAEARALAGKVRGRLRR